MVSLILNLNLFLFKQTQSEKFRLLLEQTLQYKLVAFSKMQRKDYQVEICLADCFQGNNLTLLIDVFKLNKKCFMNVLVVIVSKKRRIEPILSLGANLKR